MPLEIMAEKALRETVAETIDLINCYERRKLQ